MFLTYIDIKLVVISIDTIPGSSKRVEGVVAIWVIIQNGNEIVIGFRFFGFLFVLVFNKIIFLFDKEIV